MRARDAGQVAAVVTAAFEDGGRVAGLVTALRARRDRQVDLVAEDGGRIVGHVHLSTSWVDHPAAVVEVLTLSPLSVAPHRQRQGIGTALLAGARRAGDRLGVPALFLEGHPGYYGRRGWLRADKHGFTPPSVRVPSVAFQFLPLTSYSTDFRGALVYNDTFWSLDFVGLRGRNEDRLAPR